MAEFIGTGGLLIVVVGSGIMGETLAQGNQAIALLANSVATGAGLYALIQTFGSISGAHFNPVVSFVEFLRRRMTLKELFAYGFTQVLGAMAGVWTAHLMFGQSLFQLSNHARAGFGVLLAEVVATFGLIMVIVLSGKRNAEATPMAVALFITSAYWCTSSTSFANPAVTIARCLTDTFSGIQWSFAPGFIAAQFVGAGIAFLISQRLATSNR